MEKYSLLTKLSKCTLNIALKLTFSVFLFDWNESKYSRSRHNAKQTSFTSPTGARQQCVEQEHAQYCKEHGVTSGWSCRCPENVSILSSLFSGRRQLQPDVMSWFEQNCACCCLPHCRRTPVGDVKLVFLTLWREREYLTLISIRIVAFSNQNFIFHIIVLKLSLFSLSYILSSISKLSYLNLPLYNVSMFHVTESRCNLIQYGKQQTVSELYMDKIVLRAKWKYPDKMYELRYFNSVFSSFFSLEYRMNETYWKLFRIVSNTTY